MGSFGPEGGTRSDRRGRRAVGCEDAVEQERDQLGRARAVRRPRARVVGGEDHAPQELGGGQGFEAEPVAVGLEEGGERLDVGPAALD